MVLRTKHQDCADRGQSCHITHGEPDPAEPGKDAVNHCFPLCMRVCLIRVIGSCQLSTNFEATDRQATGVYPQVCSQMPVCVPVGRRHPKRPVRTAVSDTASDPTP